MFCQVRERQGIIPSGIYRERGFTLPELLLTIAVMGTLMVLAIPSLTRWLSATGLNSVAREVAAELQLARIKAISQNTNFRIRFDPARDTYQIEKYIAGRWESVDAPKTLPRGIRLVRTSVDPVFQPTGTVQAGTTIILENTQGRTKKVTVSFAGRIKID